MYINVYIYMYLPLFWGVHPSLSGRNFGQLHENFSIKNWRFCNPSALFKRKLNGEKKMSLSRDRKHLTISRWFFFVWEIIFQDGQVAAGHPVILSG